MRPHRRALVARGADGTLLPLVALLHGIGFVMITRLDDRARRAAGDVELSSAIGAFVATLLLVQRATDLARYRWLLFFVGAGALMLPARARSRVGTSTALASG